MSAQKLTARGALAALAGFVGMSVVAGLLVTAAVTPAIAVTGMAANNGIGAFEGLPEYLKIEKPAQNSTIYAKKNGKDVAIATFYDQNRVEVTWDNIGQNVKDATLSTEDPRFYEHGGIDIMGTIRGAATTLLGSGEVQGGSSITQQYVKNVRLMKCEVYNKTVSDANADQQKAKQAAQDKKYQDCQLSAIQQTVDRKLQEMKMAIGLEKKYSKNDILAGYLNIVGFGGQVYGIEAAARYYFGATAKTLTLPQAATLVAIVNNPSNLRIDQSKDANPANNAENGYKATLDRRDYVLDSMLKNHKITQKEHDDAIKTKIEPKIHQQSNGCLAAAAYNAAYYCDWVQHLVQDDTALGKTADDRADLLRRGGLKIYTPLNLNLQATAQKSLSSIVPAQRAGMKLGGTNTSMELGTGRVVTMVQNTPYYDPSKPKQAGATYLNLNVDSKDGGGLGLQTGSTYKLFTLLEWLKEGHSINDRVNASSNRITLPVSRWHSSCPDVATPDTWSLGNDGPGEGGNMSITAATEHSVNTAFAVMGTQLDLCGIRQTAVDLGVHLAWPYQYKLDDNGNAVKDKNGNYELEKATLSGSPATILGTNNIAPLTLAAAYAAIGNKGVYCSPVGIDKILDSTGKSLPVTKTQCKQAIDPNIAAGAAVALQAPMQSGGTAAAYNPYDGTPILGKTGTNDSAEQNWLATSTTKVATTTWTGNYDSVNGQMTDFGNIYLNGVYGRDAKGYVAKPIIAALDKTYGGSAFPQATGSVLQAKQVTVPDLTGKSPADAKNILQNLGFSFVDGGAVDGAQAAGTIEKTSPGGGSQTSVGSAVTVYTSKHNQSAIPNVVGSTAAQAVAALQAAGFTADIGDQKDPTAVVASQSPGAQTAAKPGTKVTLTFKDTGGGNNGDSGNGNNQNGNDGSTGDNGNGGG